MLNQITITPYLERNVLDYYSFSEIIDLIPDYCLYADGFVKYPDGDNFTDNPAICGLYDHLDEVIELINILAPLKHSISVDLTAYGELPSRFVVGFSHMLCQRLDPDAFADLKLIAKHDVSLNIPLTHSNSVIPIKGAELHYFGYEFGWDDIEIEEQSECVIHTLNHSLHIPPESREIAAA